MPVYLCRWPNGDISLVEAEDTDHAAILLDEFGDADEVEYHHLVDLLVNFRLDDEGTLRVEPWGESCRQEIYEVAYPALEAARWEALDEWEPGSRPIPERLRVAVEHERERLAEGRLEADKPKARTELGRELQKLMGAPAALADRLVERAGGEVLKKAKPRGPKH